MRFIHSLGFAISGIKQFILREANFRIQLIIALFVTVMGIYFQFSKIEWIVILICVALVLCLEMMNSAIEKLCDLVHPGLHATIKLIKDIAAGAVLIAAFISFICGLIIFFPHILKLF
ncbi:MAG: diacylglycerol kinase family protein [Ferruginibacter sp.]|nr:diacylglycerol kinase family protein [Ferruginibacter sp.]